MIYLAVGWILARVIFVLIYNWRMYEYFRIYFSMYIMARYTQT